MSKFTPASRVRTTYEFIKAQSATYPVQTLCRVLNVAPSGHLQGGCAGVVECGNAVLLRE